MRARENGANLQCAACSVNQEPVRVPRRLSHFLVVVPRYHTREQPPTTGVPLQVFPRRATRAFLAPQDSLSLDMPLASRTGRRIASRY